MDKARELAVIEQLGEYIKKPDEDLKSMVQGLMGHKGRVRLAFGEPITAASSLEDLTEWHLVSSRYSGSQLLEAAAAG